jgi:hypothetical protein
MESGVTYCYQEVIKATPPDHPDAKKLEGALNKLEETATFINEQKRKAENMQALSFIKGSIIGYDQVDVRFLLFVKQHQQIWTVPGTRQRKEYHQGRRGIGNAGRAEEGLGIRLHIPFQRRADEDGTYGQARVAEDGAKQARQVLQICRVLRAVPLHRVSR